MAAIRRPVLLGSVPSGGVACTSTFRRCIVTSRRSEEGDMFPQARHVPSQARQVMVPPLYRRRRSTWHAAQVLQVKGHRHG